MKPQIHKRLALIAMLICFLTASSCEKDEDNLEPFTRVQFVAIPGFDIGDYENYLLNEKVVLRYTAIANLIGVAYDYGSAIEHGLPEPDDKDFETKTSNFHHAREILGQVKTSLNSSRESIQSAALLFMSSFLSGAENHEEICPLVGSVNSVGNKALFEQLRLMLIRECNAELITDRLIEQGLKSKNWNIRSSALLLLGQRDGQQYHPKIISNFSEAESEPDRLLLLQAFSGRYSRESFSFIRQQLIESQPGPKRDVLLGVLQAYEDQHAVFSWLNENSHLMDPALVEQIVTAYFDALAPSLAIAIQFISDILMSDNNQLIGYLKIGEIFEGAYDTDEDDEEYDEIAPLFIALENAGDITVQWHAYQNDRDRKGEMQRLRKLAETRAFNAALPDYYQALQAIEETTEALYRNAGENGELIDQNLIKPLRELRGKLAHLEHVRDTDQSIHDDTN